MHWRKVGEDVWRLFDHKGEWVGYVDPSRKYHKAAVWRHLTWEPVPLPPGCGVEEAKRLVLATAALEA